MAENQYQSSLDKANAAIDKMEAKWRSIDEAILSVSRNAAKTGGQDFNSAMPKDLNDRLKKNAQYQGQVNAEVKESERLQKALNAATAKYNQATSKTNQSLQKTRFETNQLNKEERQNAVLTSKLSTEYQKQSVNLNILVKRYQELATRKKVSNDLSRAEAKEMRDVQKQAQKLDNALKDVDANVGRNYRSVGNYKNALNGASIGVKNFAGALGLTSGVYLFASAIKSAFNAVVEFDSGLKNVQKTTGLSGADIQALGDDIVKLSTKLKILDPSQLLEYATVAGQLGVKGSSNILAFTETLAKLETASDIAGEAGGASIARLLTLVDGGVENVADFGDEIVQLGNNFAATESEILGNATAIAQNTGIYKLGRQTVLAYATATKAVGIESEITGSTIGRTLGLLEKAIRTGKGIDNIAKLTGKTVSELKEQFNQDAGSVFTLLVKSLNEVDKSGGSVNGQLEKLGITAVRDQRVIGSLASAGYDTLARAMKDVETASQSLDNEFETASSKIENRIKAMNTAFTNLILGVENGSGPVSKFFNGFLDGITKGLNALAKFNMTDAEAGETISQKSYDTQSKRYKGLGEDARKYAEIEFSKSTERIGSYEREKKALEDRSKTLEDSLSSVSKATSGINNVLGLSFLSTDEAKEIKAAKERIEELNEAISIQRGISKAAGEEIGFYNKGNKETANAVKETAGAVDDITESEQKSATAKEKVTTLISGSIAAMEESISALRKQRDETATTNQEWGNYTRQIEDAEQGLNNLKIAFEGIDNLKAVGGEGFDFGSTDEDINNRILDSAKKVTDGLRDQQAKRTEDSSKESDARSEIAQQEAEKFREVFSQLGDVFGIPSDAIADLAIGIEQGFESAGDAARAFASIATGALSALGDAQNARIDNDLNALADEKEEKLAIETLTLEQREAINDEYDRKERELKKKKAENDKKVAIFQAVINTAAAVVQALPNLALSIIAGVLGAAQVAFIASTPIPALKDGDLSGKREGTVMINDAKGAKFKEIVQRNNGKVEYSEGRNVMTNLNKGDKVYKAGTAPRGMDYNDLINASINMSLADQHGKMNMAEAKHQFDRALIDEVKASNSATQSSNKDVIRAIYASRVRVPDMGKSFASAMRLEKKINR